jgi:hypothetical protein
MDTQKLSAPYSLFTLLHNKKVEELTYTDKLVDYLLNTCDIDSHLKTASPANALDIVVHYLQRYYPQYLQHDVNACDTCPHCDGDVKTDMSGCTGVCTTCGAVAFEGIGQASTHNTSYNHQVTPRRVHRYSRIVHFKDYICFMCATRGGHMDPDVTEYLKQVLRPQDATPDEIIRMLVRRKWGKYRKHAPRLAVEISGGLWQPIKISGMQLYSILNRFRLIDLCFNEARALFKGCVRRKVFFSYSYIYYRICMLEKLPHLVRDCKMLKSRRLLASQDAMWRCVCAVSNMLYEGPLESLGIYK